ncbi:hypothetical protein BDV95DRAFT_557429 [Massariosphaeria phaeospora]|uniref:WW domain-containing protein n=1 Tax=Massariosphaeria phaeospora TaxID=100035 RepID=A0A7C8MIP6_9PLEO|nr:hypothetical protein BDV95DRAFT_557429 [Massariosphaeria phaeospora]
MAEYAPPTGPPPPHLPEGWKAVYNQQYSEYFYVNIYTKQSQWEKPTHPVYPPGEASEGLPPSYPPPMSGAASTSPSGKGSFGSNNPYATTGPGTAQMSEDERLARQLQEQEQANARAHYGEQQGTGNTYYNQPQGAMNPYPQNQSQNPYPPSNTHEQGKSKGLLGKLLSKAAGSGSKPHGGYGHTAPGGYGQHGYPQQQMYGRRPGGGGMGMGGAAALGVGGGLLGGAMLGSAMGDDGGGDYGGGDGGGDFGGGDGGGGDFGGGDFGGGDGGGGDFGGGDF